MSKTFYEPSAKAPTLKETLLASLSRSPEGPRIAALRNINLEIAPGESLGIVGANGSGKSTLLRIISGIAQPTEGTAEVSGRIVGMIELGAGFHADLTGEENVRLQGTIHGFTQAQIAERMDRIFDYAGLQDFRAVELRFYSSGMIARLGFAIAIHSDPEILLIDEVLAVGDQNFQERCLESIARLRRAGITIIFVTHNMEFAERVCDRILWLKQGKCHREGTSLDILREYHAEMIRENYAVPEGELTKDRVAIDLPGRFGVGGARIAELRIMDTQGRIRHNFSIGEPFAIEVDYEADESIPLLDCWIVLDFEDGSNIASWRTDQDGAVRDPCGGKGTFRLRVDAPPFLPGRYTLTPILTRPGKYDGEYDMHYRLHHFAVTAGEEQLPGVPILLKPRIEIPK
ncbi:ABC transporter ATP-binding protein [Candidatus Sumerlaeota bacterium]|nr:ABC transporter ATP-binding protein [Candidatus Sumerlaeota bacterium]